MGCAYRLGAAERTLPGGYQQLAIPVFQNRTAEVGIETAFTNAIIREFARSKVARVVAADVAPLRLEGTLEDLKIENRSAALEGEIKSLPAGAVLTTEYRIVVRTVLRLVRLSDQAVVWEGSFVNEKVYPAPRIGAAVVNSANVLYNQSARRQNIANLATEMMEEAHSRMTENF